MLTLESFEEAAEIVKQVTQETKLVKSSYFSELTGNKVFFKPENMQRTGAYKVRGAYYKISTLSDEERGKGLITASAGNHAQGVAYAAHKYGVKAVIVMPTTTPLIKVERTKGYGAEVILHGDVYDEACAYALELAEEKGYTFIHPFDDPAVATGQGTIAMEIIQELPLVDYILVPIGGGGLATGVSTLAKLLNPHIKVIGVEPAGAVLYRLALSLILFAAKLQRFMNICFLLAKSFIPMGQTAQSLCCEAFFCWAVLAFQAKSPVFWKPLLLLSPPSLISVYSDKSLQFFSSCSEAFNSSAILL